MESTGQHSDSLVVLTALDVEYEAVRAHLVDPRPQLHQSGTLFEVGRLDGTPWRVALAELGDGNQGAAVLTERAIAMFRPRAVAFVGVAGALKGDIELGDVVVATHVYAYHGGKDEDGAFHSRPRVWPVRQELDQLARFARRSGSWTGLLPERPPGASRPAVHLKPVAAGEVVLNSADSPLRRQLRRNYQDAAAIEMEGAGVAQAAHLNAALPALIVRGISDRADGEKYDADAEGWQSRAARNAAAFAFSVLRELPPGGDPAPPGPGAPMGPVPGRFPDEPSAPAPAPPPHPDAGTTPDDAGPAAHRRLLRWARRLSDDLDLVDSPRPDRGTGSPPQLSGGLYVRRAVQDRVMEALYDDDPKAVLVTGDAGNGKSSLLWGLARDLTALEDAEVFLVNAAWLLRPLSGTPGTPMLTPATVVSGATHARTRGRTPVVLLDTADLLLHDDYHEMTLLDLCEDLAAAGVRLVLTSRPEEANRLRTGFVRMSLGPYDDSEIPHAIRGHAALYCPDAVPRDDEARVRRLMEPVARGLPVREVCRSPLQLRLLFELARDDGAFPSAEIDATGLYRRYWDHRVVTDRRHHGNQSATAPEDLSSLTGAIAVVLMSAGRTELSREELVERLTSAHGGPRPSWPYEPARVRSSLELLTDRGVLARGASDDIHFFHQTMFEYAAARGLLHLSGARALLSLCEWVGSHPRDFFVGAILEQLLMLAAGSERYRGPVRDTLTRMAAHTDAVILHTVAVAVAARNPAVGVSVEPLLATAPHGVARRYAVLAPTVRDTDVDALLPQLRGLWERREPSLREAVLEALERLAAQNAVTVHAALADWGCVRELTGRRTGGAGIEVLPRLLVLTSHVDVASARKGLMEMLDFALSRGLAELASGVMTLWARHWETLGSPEWAAAVQERLKRVRVAPKSYDVELFQSALARVLAASWTHDHGLPGDHGLAADGAHGPDGGPAPGTHPWTHRLDHAVALLEADDHDTAGNAGLIAAAAVLATLPHGHWAIEATLDRCLEMTGQGALHALQHRMVFPQLLSADCAAAESLVHRLAGMLKALPCPENQPVTPPQRRALVARRILAHRDVPPHRVRQVLEHSVWDADSDLWLSQDGLATLLLPAALGGHPTAVSRIEKATTAPAAARNLVRRSLHRAVTDSGLHTERHIGLLVNLSLMDADTVLLEALTTGRAKKGIGPLPPLAHERVLGALRASAPALTGLIADEIAEGNSGKRQRQALTLWECSVSVGTLPVPDLAQLQPRYGTFSDQKTRAAFLGLVGTVAAREPAQYATAHTFLSELVFDAAGDVPRLDDASASTRNAARKALFHAACESGPLTPSALTMALDLAFAPPTDAGLISGLGQLVRRLSTAHGAAPAAELLIRVIGAAVASQQGRAAENHLAKALRGAMDSVFDHGSPAVYRRLWEHLKEPGPEDDADHVVLPERYALGLVSCAIRRSYAATRHDLEALVAHPRVPRPTKMWISDQLSARSRERTEHDLSWVLDGETPGRSVAG